MNKVLTFLYQRYDRRGAILEPLYRKVCSGCSEDQILNYIVAVHTSSFKWATIIGIVMIGTAAINGWLVALPFLVLILIWFDLRCLFGITRYDRLINLNLIDKLFIECCGKELKFQGEMKFPFPEEKQEAPGYKLCCSSCGRSTEYHNHISEIVSEWQAISGQRIKTTEGDSFL